MPCGFVLFTPLGCLTYFLEVHNLTVSKQESIKNKSTYSLTSTKMLNIVF